MVEPIDRAWLSRHAELERISTLDLGHAVHTISNVRDRRDGHPIGLTIAKISPRLGDVQRTYFVPGHPTTIATLDEALAILATIRKAKEPADA